MNTWPPSKNNFTQPESFSPSNINFRKVDKSTSPKVGESTPPSEKTAVQSVKEKTGIRKVPEKMRDALRSMSNKYNSSKAALVKFAKKTKDDVVGWYKTKRQPKEEKIKLSESKEREGLKKDLKKELTQRLEGKELFENKRPTVPAEPPYDPLEEALQETKLQEPNISKSKEEPEGAPAQPDKGKSKVTFEVTEPTMNEPEQAYKTSNIGEAMEKLKALGVDPDKQETATKKGFWGGRLGTAESFAKLKERLQGYYTRKTTEASAVEVEEGAPLVEPTLKDYRDFAAKLKERFSHPIQIDKRDEPVFRVPASSELKRKVINDFREKNLKFDDFPVSALAGAFPEMTKSEAFNSIRELDLLSDYSTAKTDEEKMSKIKEKLAGHDEEKAFLKEFLDMLDQAFKESWQKSGIGSNVELGSMTTSASFTDLFVARGSILEEFENIPKSNGMLQLMIKNKDELFK